MEDDLGAVVLGVVYLYQRSSGGHDDSGGHAGRLGGVGHALSMVAGGGGDKTTGLLLIRQSADLKIGPPKLVGPGDLHIFRLEIDVVAAGFGQVGGVNQRGGPKNTLECAPGVFKLFQGKHRRFSFLSNQFFKIILNLGGEVNEIGQKRRAILGESALRLDTAPLPVVQ